MSSTTSNPVLFEIFKNQSETQLRETQSETGLAGAWLASNQRNHADTIPI